MPIPLRPEIKAPLGTSPSTSNGRSSIVAAAQRGVLEKIMVGAPCARDGQNPPLTLPLHPLGESDAIKKRLA